MWKRVISFFFPVADPAGLDFARAEVLVGGALAVVVVAFPMKALVLAGVLPATPMAVPAALGAIAALLLLRFARSVDLASFVLSATWAAGATIAALDTRDLSMLIWLGLVPIGALLYSTIRQALLWFGVAVVLIPSLGAWLILGGQTTSPPLYLLMMRLVIGVTLFFGLTLAFAMRRLQAQESLAQARDEADRANRAKSQFLASFSHEVRTPLNGVLGTADGLLAGPLPPEVREQLLIIQRSGSSLLRTINDVLELSRIEAGRLELFPVTTNLRDVLREVVDLFDARARQRGLSLELSVSADHPPHVLVDDLRLRQVLQNLIGNAVKFTQHGTVRVKLEATALAGNVVHASITVEDTGPGVSAEDQARLFTIFAQARPRLDRTEGSGLGLALSRQFTELMGGTLTLKSELGVGSCFRVELTLPVVSSPPQPVASPEMVEVSVGRLKVLLVDDNEINLKVAEALVRRLGHDVVSARDGHQALQAVDDNAPDLVLMDCHMPVLDGLEATRQLRARGDRRPIVAVTASSAPEDREKALEAGMNAFLAKPLSLEALKQVVSQLVPPDTRTPRVLVVDDDSLVRHATARMLRAEGFVVDEAPDTVTAAAQLKNSAPRCVLIDRILGGSDDGLDFALRLKRAQPDIRVVVTSGNAPTTAQEDAMRAAGTLFLPKPFTRVALLHSLSRELETRRTG